MSEAEAERRIPDEDEKKDEKGEESAPDGVERQTSPLVSIVTLIKPQEWNGIAYDQITLREPTVDDLIKTDKAKGDMERAAILINVLGKIPMKALKMVKARDMERLMEEIDYLKNA